MDAASASSETGPDTEPVEDRGGLFAGKLCFWVPILPLLLLDLWSKAWAFDYVPKNWSPQGPWDRQQLRVDYDFLPDPFGFALVNLRNTGTVWGKLQDSTVPLMVLRSIAVLALIWFARQTPRKHRVQQVTLGAILAGALGNLYDNFFCQDRGVRDFLFFFRKGENGEVHGFPAFNAADSYITCGAILLMILLWVQPDRKQPKQAS